MRRILTLMLGAALALACVTPTSAQDAPAKKGKKGKSGKAAKKKKGQVQKGLARAR